MAEPGAVAWQFERKGVISIPKKASGGPIGEDDIMLAALEAGAEDVADGGDTWDVTTAPTDMPAVRDALDAAGMGFESADVTLVASNLVPLDNESDAKKVLRLVDLLEDLDDVQNVYANFDIPDSILELVEA
jgi:transcriptional/translational regulatory protein YebC/TACO1